MTLASHRATHAALQAALLIFCAALTSCGGSKSARSPALAARTPLAPPAPALSPAGLPLAKPAFALSGLASAGASPENAVALTFHHPPSAGLLVDLSSGRVLWQLHPHARLHIASLTKMMTALIAVDSDPPRTSVLVRHDDVEVPGSKVGVLPVGRHVSLESMLYGLMLPSGNDAAYAIAETVAGTAARFVARMNDEAARLGLGCTRYASPSGYVNAHNYSCAADLAMLAHLDLARARIARIARTHYAAIPFPIRGHKLYLTNNNPLFRYRYRGLTGLKTGYTEAAGRCLVATATRHRVSLVAVVLDSPAPANQARALLNDGFTQVYHLPRVREEPLPPFA